MVEDERLRAFLEECNRVKEKLEALDPGKRYEYVVSVLRWLESAFNDIASVANTRNVFALRKKLKEYKELVRQKKAEIAVVLTYIIKPEYQKFIAPVVLSLLFQI
ncbi:MAG: hypothetical protein J7J61_00815 [Candidatus Hydrothermae bacterium]|nr:hypothetical protein [Candidatus Hydrothermae bacterium]